MNADKKNVDMEGNAKPDGLEQHMASSGGWKIKRRKIVVPKNVQKPPFETSQEPARRELLLPKSPEMESHKPNKKQLQSFLQQESSAAAEEQQPRSRLRFQQPALLWPGLIAVAAFLTLFFDYVTAWFEDKTTLAGQDSATVAATLNEPIANPATTTPHLLVHSVALPALEDEGPLPIYFRLSSPADRPIDIAYETQANTAEENTDYSPKSGVVTIEPGDTAVAFAIPLIDDDQVESIEVFRLLLSVEQNIVELTANELTATILDDDEIASADGQ